MRALALAVGAQRDDDRCLNSPAIGDRTATASLTRSPNSGSRRPTPGDFRESPECGDIEGWRTRGSTRGRSISG